MYLNVRVLQWNFTKHLNVCPDCVSRRHRRVSCVALFRNARIYTKVLRNLGLNILMFVFLAHACLYSVYIRVKYLVNTRDSG